MEVYDCKPMLCLYDAFIQASICLFLLYRIPGGDIIPNSVLSSLTALPLSTLRDGRALLSSRFEEEVQAWAEAVENNNQEATLTHWRAALNLSDKITLITCLIGIKKEGTED